MGCEPALSRSGRTVRARSKKTTVHDPPRESKRNAGGEESETKEEAREVAARGRAEVFLRFVQFSNEERPCRAGTVHLVEDGGSGTEHPVSVAGVGRDVEGELARPASEFVPSSPTAGPTVVELDGPAIGRRFALRGEKAVTRIALLALAASFVVGCAPEGPLGTVGAIVTRPHHRPGDVRLGKAQRPRGPPRASEAQPPPLASHRHAIKGDGPGHPRSGPRTGHGRPGPLLAERRGRKRVRRRWRDRARDRPDRRRAGVPGSAHRDRDGAPADRPASADVLPGGRGLDHFHEDPAMTGDTEWVIRQGFACAFVRAPSPVAAVETAAKRLGHMGGWKVGPAADQEVFAADEYREHAQPGDYTRSVIVGPPSH